MSFRQHCVNVIWSLCIALISINGENAKADVLFEDSFNYEDGPITATSGGVWTAHSGTAGQVVVQSGKALISGVNSEDVGVNFQLVSGALYAKFTVKLTELPSLNAYFAHFASQGSADFKGRAFATTAGAGAGAYRFGIVSTSSVSSPYALVPIDCFQGATYTLVLRVQQGDSSVRLWVSPNSEADQNVSFADGGGASAVLQRFCLRETTGMGAFQIDDLRVATTFNEALSGNGMAPFIVTQPTSRVVTAGSGTTFNVVATGTQPLTYRWWHGNSLVPNATANTLQLSNVQLVDSGIYRADVTNMFGRITSMVASLTVLSNLDGSVTAPTYPSPPPVDTGKDSLVVITHGRTTTDPPDLSWIDRMVQAVKPLVPSNWFVLPYRWHGVKQSYASILDVDNNAETVGRKAGADIIDAARLTSHGKWEHIHFIAHSAGAALVEEAAAVVQDYSNRNGWNTEIHTTFLDPYTGPTDSRRTKYGMHSTWAENYFGIDSETHDQTLGRTGGRLDHARNVDVTALDSSVVLEPIWCSQSPSSSPLVAPTPCRYQPITPSHGWPISFYQNTIPPNTQTGSGSYGYSRSKEGGGWSGRGGYPPGNQPAVLGGSYTIAQGPTNTSVATLNFNALPNAISETGTVQITPSGFIATTGAPHKSLRAPHLVGKATSTGDPVWISVPVQTTTAVNYVSADLTFASSSGSVGLVTVFWNDEQVAVIDEPYTIPGTRTYTFEVANAFLDKNNCLGFRLDPFSDVTSSVTVANVVTGFAGLAEPTTLSLGIITSGDHVFSLSGAGGYTFLIEATIDFTEWTPISHISLEDGSVAYFTDPGANTLSRRFYRAVLP